MKPKATVKILKPIQPRGWTSYFHPETSALKYDPKERGHMLKHQQGKYYGQVGDMCTYLSQADLLELERNGFIKISYRLPTSKKPAPSQQVSRDDARAMQALMMHEVELQGLVKNLAVDRGWLFYHTHRSDRSDEGFPDCIMIRRNTLIVAELKRENKNPTDAQQSWLDAFTVMNNYDRQGDIEIISECWRPSDWLSGAIEKRLR
jgi:hypothetical protein